MKLKEKVCFIIILIIQLVSCAINIFMLAVRNSSKDIFIYCLLALISGIFLTSMSIAGIVFAKADISKVYNINILILTNVCTIAYLIGIVYIILSGQQILVTKYNLNILYYLFYCFAEKLTSVIISIKLMITQERVKTKVLLQTVNYTLLTNET